MALLNEEETWPCPGCKAPVAHVYNVPGCALRRMPGTGEPLHCARCAKCEKKALAKSRRNKKREKDHFKKVREYIRSGDPLKMLQAAQALSRYHEYEVDVLLGYLWGRVEKLFGDELGYPDYEWI